MDNSETNIENNNKPEYRIFFERKKKDGSTELVKIGAAWKHKSGDGLTVRMDNGGKFVLFPNDSK